MSEHLSDTGFWAKIKHILGHHNTMPNTIDGIVDGSNIADIFQEKYKSLYNYMSFDPHQMAAPLEETKLTLLIRFVAAQRHLSLMILTCLLYY